MCSSRLIPVVTETSDTIRNTRSRIITGAMLPITSRNQFGTRPKAMMKVTRDSASGNTHNSGTDAMSVVMWKVTPSIRLDGTNASATHFSLRAVVGGGSTGGGPGGG